MILFLIHTGKKETDTEKLRSILAQLEYQYLVESWEAQGVPFKAHLHVPEVHPVTGTLFCEREDEGHVLKVTTCACITLILHVYIKISITSSRVFIISSA